MNKACEMNELMRRDPTEIHPFFLLPCRDDRLRDEKWVTSAASAILRSVRDLLNLQKREVARLTGISHIRYRLLERGDVVPTADEWLRIAETMGISLGALENGFLFATEVNQVLRRKKSRVRWRESEPGVYRPRGDYRFLKRSELSLIRGDLSFARFTLAEIPNSNFAGALLKRANFAWSDLSHTILSGADLRGAQLGGAVLVGADLRGADLDGAHLMLATYDTSTQLPFSYEEAFLRGMIKVNLEDNAVFEAHFPSDVVRLDSYRGSQTP